MHNIELILFNFATMEAINIYTALEVMRKLSAENIPFSIEFVSCNRSLATSNGLVRVEKALLTKGYRNDQSQYAQNLIAFQNVDTGENKQFWLPLLMKFNGIKITYDRIY